MISPARTFSRYAICVRQLITAILMIQMIPLLNDRVAAQESAAAASTTTGDAATASDAATDDAATDDAATDDAAKEELPAAEAAVDTSDEGLKEGHSVHGEVFNEGPRQAAYLMEGVGTVRFPVTTSNELARKFVEQGVAQLHGFWYFESERSFRQAAMLDPNCAIAYWGMAMSNRNNSSRAKGFISEAMTRREHAGGREKLYIQALDRYLSAKADNDEEKRKRAERYVSDLEDLLFEFPDDLEAKAFLCEFFWSARGNGLKLTSYLTVDAMIQDILDEEPLHPVHHYRIHLWDNRKPEKALESAALCGLSAPAIAHMWHMPGHIYSRVKRYHDAVYQQEASARVDHAHMMKDRVLPDRIHNFAHNNEWCIRNLIYIGRVHDAVDLALNMISLPRHPKYNHIGKFGSYKYGRQRLLEVLRTFGLHEQIVAYAETPWLADTEDQTEDLARNRAVGAALAAVGMVEKAAEMRSKLQSTLEETQAEQHKAAEEARAKAVEEKKDDKEIEKAGKTAEEKHQGRVADLEKALFEIDGRLAAQTGDFEKALELLEKAGGVRVEDLVQVMLDAGKTDDAVKRITEHVKSRKNEVLPLAAQVETLWRAEKRDEARTAFEQLRTISATIHIEIPAFARLAGIAAALEFPADWRLSLDVPADIGARPNLDALGPFRWQPVSAALWTLPDMEGTARSLADYRGRPVVVIFYLGYGCLHCAEQLQKFAPKYEQFRQAGFEMIAISTDQQENLRRALDDYESGFPFPLTADPELNVFREYRCYDDFENAALHGTFVIDGRGAIRWQDISYEPFMDPDFVLQEAQRQLSIDHIPGSPDPLSPITAGVSAALIE